MERYLSILWLNVNEPLHSHKQTNNQIVFLHRGYARIQGKMFSGFLIIEHHRTKQMLIQPVWTLQQTEFQKFISRHLWRSLINYSKTKQFYVFSDIAEWGEVMVSFCNCVWNALCTCPGTHTSSLHWETKFQLQWPWIHFQFGEKNTHCGAGEEILYYHIVTIFLLQVFLIGMWGRVRGFRLGFPDTY